MTGRVILVGGGPGDPDLMTVAGLRAIEDADVILYDRLAPLACLEHARTDAERIDVGKIPRGEFTPQERINELLIEHAKAGKLVVRFKGGDSFVFGRGGEEWLACQAAGVPVSVIPGVTSSVSVPELAGVPVTHRGVSQGFSVVSGHVAPDDERSSLDWDALARSNTTIVVLMGVHNLGKISARLLSAGMAPDTPAVLIEDGTQPTERVLRTTLAKLGAEAETAGVKPPAIAVIGGSAGVALN